MVEKQAANTFSEQVDRLLAGQPAPGNDPLLSLASEMVAGPALEPSPAFAQRLRRQLLSSPERVARPRWWWSLAGVAVMLLLAVALALVWSPGSPSAAEVLARAADAVAIAPGQIEYFVTENTGVVKSIEWVVNEDHTLSPYEFEYGYLTERWSHGGTISESHLTPFEVAGFDYAVDDTDLSHPLNQYYGTFSSTYSKFCMLGPDPSFPPDWDAHDQEDSEGCVTFDSSPTTVFAKHTGESFQDWFNRLREKTEEIEFKREQFNDRPVYSLTYHGEYTAAKLSFSYTVVLYFDRATYLCVGSKHEDPHSVITQAILDYQVLNPADLGFDPFVWPPEQ
jgi:hypothetical protein